MPAAGGCTSAAPHNTYAHSSAGLHRAEPVSQQIRTATVTANLPRYSYFSTDSHIILASPTFQSPGLAQNKMLRNNAYMADVPIYVAVITAAAGVMGAAIPQAGIMLREIRQAERDRRERSVAAGQQACIDLLSAGSALSAQIENIRVYRGEAGGLRARLEQMRECLATTQVHAASVGMLAPRQLTDHAGQLAAAARSLAKAVEANVDLENGVVVGELDVGPLDALLATFRTEAVEYARN